MKKYYAECTVSFTDYSNDERWDSQETYSFVIDAENKKKGKILAKKKGLECFEADLGGGLFNIEPVIGEFYETSDDARP